MSVYIGIIILYVLNVVLWLPVFQKEKLRSEEMNESGFVMRWRVCRTTSMQILLPNEGLKADAHTQGR